MKTYTYEQAKAKSAALIELGNDEVYINEPDLPWHIATHCEPGGTHRLEMATSVWFYGTCPDTGLKFRWTFDIEPSGANGSSEYIIDKRGCQEITKALQGDARIGWRKYLRECATQVRAKGIVYREAAERQLTDAAILSDLASFEVPHEKESEPMKCETCGAPIRRGDKFYEWPGDQTVVTCKDCGGAETGHQPSIAG